MKARSSVSRVSLESELLSQMSDDWKADLHKERIQIAASLHGEERRRFIKKYELLKLLC